MGNRSRTEIVAMILNAANGGETKTKIMYFAFLSYGQLKEYLSILIENNLLEYLDGTHKFKTTENGLNYLKMHNESGESVTTEDSRADDESIVILVLLSVLFHPPLISNEFTFLTISKNNLKISF